MMMNRKMTEKGQIRPKKEIAVLFENEQVVVFDKPARLIVIPSPKKEATTLVSEVNAQYHNERGQSKLYPCHRLDRDTSGCIIFAKGKKNQQVMMGLFKNHKIEKRYIAFIQGAIKKKKGEIRGFISGVDRLKYKPGAKGEFAHSYYRLIQQKKHFGVVEVEPITGRTNQIRIQFSRLKHPLVGDRKFSIVKNYPLKFKRTALHASTLKWDNPFGPGIIKIKSELPKDMEVFCASN